MRWKWNPVYKMEKMTSSRSARMSVIVFGMNLILTITALIMLYTIMHETGYTGEIPYQSFIQLYRMIAFFEFTLILLIVPALTSGAVSGERERQTLDLLLSTKMNCWEIIEGMRGASVRTVRLVSLSGFPILSLVFIYGGVSEFDLVFLFAYYVITALFSGSLGIMLSALFKKTSTSTAVSYVVLLLLTAGTGAATYLFYRISYTRFIEISDPSFYPTAGKSIYFLLVNPAISFYYFMNGQTGSGREFYEFLARMGVYEKNFILENWVMIGIGIQFVLSVIFICVAVRTIDPMKKKYSVLL